MKTFNLVLGLLLLFGSLTSFGYESMIRKGYSSCIACHQSPSGGGILTDYGKIITAGVSFFNGQEYKEGNLKKKIRLNGKVDHAMYLRYAFLRGYEKEEDDDEGPLGTTFPMQADYAGLVKFDKTMVIAQAGRRPDVFEDIDESEKYYFRELKAVHKLNDESFVTIGRQRQNIGLGLEDHTIFNKKYNRFNITDLETVVGYDRITDQYQYNISLFAPSYSETEDNQESGASFEVRKQIGLGQIGLGGLYGSTAQVKRNLVDVLFKYPLGKFLVMLEAVATKRDLDHGDSTSQNSNFLRLSYFPLDAWEIAWQRESISRDEPYELDASSTGFMTHFRFTRNLSLRTDVKNTLYEGGDNAQLALTQLIFNWW